MNYTKVMKLIEKTHVQHIRLEQVIKTVGKTKEMYILLKYEKQNLK